MIAAELLAGEVPPPAAIVEVLHPLTIEAAAALIDLELPGAWTAQLGHTPSIMLTDPDGVTTWSILLVDHSVWQWWSQPLSDADHSHGRTTTTAQAAVDATVRAYRAGMAAVAS